MYHASHRNLWRCRRWVCIGSERQRAEIAHASMPPSILYSSHLWPWWVLYMRASSHVSARLGSLLHLSTVHAFPLNAGALLLRRRHFGESDLALLTQHAALSANAPRPREPQTVSGVLNMCICVNCKLVDTCKAYHFVEQKARHSGSTLTP